MSENHHTENKGTASAFVRKENPNFQTEIPFSVANANDFFTRFAALTAKNRIGHDPCPKKRPCRCRHTKNVPTEVKCVDESQTNDSNSIKSLDAFLRAKRVELGLKDGERLPEAFKRLKKIKKVIMMIDGCDRGPNRLGMLGADGGYWDRKLGVFIRGVGGKYKKDRFKVKQYERNRKTRNYAKNGKYQRNNQFGKKNRSNKKGEKNNYGRGEGNGKERKKTKDKYNVGGKNLEKNSYNSKTKLKGISSSSSKKGISKSRTDSSLNKKHNIATSVSVHGNLKTRVDSSAKNLPTTQNIRASVSAHDNIKSRSSTQFETRPETKASELGHSQSMNLNDENKSNIRAKSVIEIISLDEVGSKDQRILKEENNNIDIQGKSDLRSILKETSMDKKENSEDNDKLPNQSTNNGFLIRTFSGNFQPMPVGFKLLTLNDQILEVTSDSYFQQMHPDLTWESLKLGNIKNCVNKTNSQLSTLQDDTTNGHLKDNP